MSTKVSIHIKNIAASEEKPFDLTVEGQNIGHETSHMTYKVFETTVPSPSIATKSHVISVSFTIRERNVNSTQKFDLIKDGCHILLAHEPQSGLKIVQRHDGNFGEKQVFSTVTPSSNAASSGSSGGSGGSSSPRMGFVVDPITGQKKYRSSGVESPRAQQQSSPRAATSSSVTTNSPRATTSDQKATTTAAATKYTVDDLEKLAVMKQQGIITEQEFAQIKKQVLGL